MIRLEKAQKFANWLYNMYGSKVTRSLTRYGHGWEEDDILLGGE